MADPNDIWIRVYVPESRLAEVRPGSGATLRVDGVPGTLDAVVESVSQRGEFTPANLQTPDERGKQVFGVRLRLRRPDSRIKAGMYATVTSLGSTVNK
jgi:HlyD family secretion protein